MFQRRREKGLGARRCMCYNGARKQVKLHLNRKVINYHTIQILRLQNSEISEGLFWFLSDDCECQIHTAKK